MTDYEEFGYRNKKRKIMHKKGKIHIGTSGWHYKHWKGTFYPEGTKDIDQLGLYIKTFKTVEINSSFYHLPLAQTFINWREKVPADFIFSVKGSRYITHLKKLKVTKEELVQFLDNAMGLKEKMGPILFQLPPGWNMDIQRLDDFLQLLPEHYRYVFEFRNHTWYNEEVYDLLKKHNCSFCIYELGGHLSPKEITADFVYVRLHGPDNKYEGSYPAETLKMWAKQCLQWQEKGLDVFVYFDNDQYAYAAFNAMDLKRYTE